MTSRRGGGTGAFRFCLCVLLVDMIDGSCRSVCLVSRFARRLVLSVPFFFLIVIGAGSGERGGDGDDAPFYSARFLIFASTRPCSCSWRDGIDMGRISVMENDNGKSVRTETWLGQ